MASTDPWWVIEANIGASSPTYQVVQGPPPGPNPAFTVTANGTSVKVTGPFASQAAAQATIPKGAAMGPGGPTAPGAAAPNTSVPGTSGLFSAFSSIANALTAFYDEITNGKMWRSLGWLVLGIVLMFIGVLLWIGPDLLKRSPAGVIARGLG